MSERTFCLYCTRVLPLHFSWCQRWAVAQHVKDTLDGLKEVPDGE